MKKLMLILCLLFVASVGMTASYTVELSTHNPTTAVGQTDGSYPNIADGAKIQQIVLTNSGATVQTVTLYEQSDSSTTANAILTAVLESTGTLVIPYTATERIENFGAKTSATGSTVNMSVQYK